MPAIGQSAGAFWFSRRRGYHQPFSVTELVRSSSLYILWFVSRVRPKWEYIPAELGGLMWKLPGRSIEGSLCLGQDNAQQTPL
jgi:hypothetical protein